MKTNSGVCGASCGRPNYPRPFFRGTNNSPKRGGGERGDLWRRIGDFDAAIDDYSIVIWSFDRPERKKEQEMRHLDNARYRRITSSGISGPIKRISIHPFPPSSPGMHQTGSDNPFYDLRDRRQSWPRCDGELERWVSPCKISCLTRK